MDAVYYYGKNNKVYQLGGYIGGGGEGKVCGVIGNKHLSVKIYSTHPSEALKEKIFYMISHQPSSDLLDVLAWPIDYLNDSSGRFIGFVMKKMDTNSNIKDTYNIQNISTHPSLSLNIKQYICIAINLCTMVKLMHEQGYIIGDFNPTNIGVNTKNCHIAYFDVDSLYLQNKETKKHYLCLVAYSGYIAPEVLKKIKKYGNIKNIPYSVFTEESDYFGLGIHIFRLLMNGYHPFNGIDSNIRASTAANVDNDEAVVHNLYCNKTNLKPMSALTPDISLFPPYIKSAFDKTFIDGDKDPKKRVTAKEWKNLLARYLQELTQCSSDNNHYFWKYAKNYTCPYCQAIDRHFAVNNYVSAITPTLTMSLSSISLPTPPNITATCSPLINSTPKKKKIFKKLHINPVWLFCSLFLIGCTLAPTIPLIVRSAKNKTYNSNYMSIKYNHIGNKHEDYSFYYLTLYGTISNNSKHDIRKLSEEIYLVINPKNQFHIENIDWNNLSKNTVTDCFIEVEIGKNVLYSEEFYKSSINDIIIKHHWTYACFDDYTTRNYNDDLTIVN